MGIVPALGVPMCLADHVRVVHVVLHGRLCELFFTEKRKQDVSDDLFLFLTVPADRLCSDIELLDFFVGDALDAPLDELFLLCFIHLGDLVCGRDREVSCLNGLYDRRDGIMCDILHLADLRCRNAQHLCQLLADAAKPRAGLLLFFQDLVQQRVALPHLRVGDLPCRNVHQHDVKQTRIIIRVMLHQTGQEPGDVLSTVEQQTDGSTPPVAADDLIAAALERTDDQVILHAALPKDGIGELLDAIDHKEIVRRLMQLVDVDHLDAVCQSVLDDRLQVIKHC